MYISSTRDNTLQTLSDLKSVSLSDRVQIVTLVYGDLIPGLIGETETGSYVS